MHTPRRRRWAQAGSSGAITLGVAALVVGLVGPAVGVTGQPEEEEPRESELPVFEFADILTDYDELEYNPNDEFIFPSVFHAGEHLDEPLGEWYLYYAPHDPPGGISMMYADSLDGPWVEHPDNPLIEDAWPPHYEVSHVSSADAFWHAEEDQMIMYFHGENSETRYAYSDDGVSFEYGGIAVDNSDGPPGTTESSYARVFEHPDPTSEYDFAMFYMWNWQDDVRRIAVAESHDGREWDVRQEPLIVPGFAEGQNVSSADLWEWDGQLYVVYHASSGSIHARTVNEALTETGPAWTLHSSSGVEPDIGRVAAPEIVTHGGQTYLFYEGGHRLGATIAYARHNPDAERPEAPAPDPDPRRETCSGAGSDEFDDDLETSLWTIVGEDADRHEVVDGDLVIPTYASGVDGAAFPLQDLPEGAWEVTTEVTLEVAERFQQGGLLVYESATDYVKLVLGESSNGTRLEYIWRQDGNDRHNASEDTRLAPADLKETFWLRLSSDGESLTASVSPEGEAFWPLGRPVDLGQIDPIGVGPFAMRGATEAPEIHAHFSWFRWTPSEAEREDCAGDVGPPPGDDPSEPPGEEPTDPPGEEPTEPPVPEPTEPPGTSPSGDSSDGAGAPSPAAPHDGGSGRLPETGAAGMWLVALLGSGLVLAGLALRRKVSH